MKWDIHPGIGDYVFLADRAAEKSRMFFLRGAIMLFLPLPRVHSEYNQLRINMISDFRRISNLPCMLARIRAPGHDPHNFQPTGGQRCK